MSKRRRSMVAKFALAALLVPGLAQAQVEHHRDTKIAAKVYHHPELDIQTLDREVGQLSAQSMSQVRDRLTRLGAPAASARVDHLSGRFTTLLPSVPLIPGKGVGNHVQWADLNVAPRNAQEREQVALHAFLGYLKDNQAALQIDLRDLSAEPRVASHGDEIYQIHIDRVIGGVPVRGSSISAVINNGNLILVHLQQWGDRPAPQRTTALSGTDALDAVTAHIHPLRGTFSSRAEPLYLTMANQKGYYYRLVWSLKGQIQGDIGNWEALVDANTGEVVSFEDTNHYGEALGGVFPVSNDGKTPDGTEQQNWPVPFLTLSGGGATDTGGNFSATGSVTSSLSGPYVKIMDTCGAISLTQSGTINYGSSSGTDCTTPGMGGAGNTHASRTAFYEINKRKECARGQLPTNTWLQGQLTANMNLNMTCNAYWDGRAVNFFRSGGGCANTGEIAAVFDHEWGHGMDQNDVSGAIAGPSGEGIADVYAALRLNTSCIGRGFMPTQCTGNGDPCLSCTGVRDIDYLKRKSGKPHTYSWSNLHCLGEVHCVGAVHSEAIWSLWKRQLAAAPFNMDSNTAMEVATRLTFIGAGAVVTWFSGGAPHGGCGAGSGYMHYLAADDDNGNLNDGTPHMTAIYNAFNDQQIACATPAVKNSGCTGMPTTAPTVTATTAANTVNLSWTTVPGASKYQIFRTEGVFACDFGKVKVGETTGTTFSSANLQNGRNYSYVVIPVGTSNSCMGPSSACTTAQPH